MSTVERRLFFGLLLLAAFMVSRGSHAMGGDAPYYLAISHSIGHDFDLDLRDQFAPDGEYVFRQDAATDLVRAGRDGRLYPTEGLAFGVIMTPVLIIADAIATSVPESILARVRWNRGRAARDLISLTLALLYAWTAVLTLRVLSRLRGGERGWLVVALAFATPPALFVSILALTELPAALLCIWFLSEMTRPGRRPMRAALPLVLLPWFDVRYVLITAAGAAWLWRSERGSREGWHRPEPALVLTLLSVGLLGALRMWMFGSILPDRAAGGPWTGVSIWLGGLVALLFDPDLGLLWVAPFWVIALAGVRSLARRRTEYVRFAGTAVIGLWVLAAVLGTGGEPGPPARFVVPVLPVLVPLLAEGLAAISGRPARWLAYASLAWTLSISVLLIDRPGRMWTAAGTGIARLPASAIEWVVRFNAPASKLARRGIAGDGEAFQRAVRHGEVEVVGLFLEDGWASADGLVTAVQSGRAEMVQLLLEHGAGTGREGGRALAWARAGGRDDMIAILAGAGASLDATDAEGDTALMFAVANERADERQLLIDQGADLDARNSIGRTAAAVAVWHGDSDALRDLIAAGADVDQADADGWTPLMVAARNGRLAEAERLIAAGADVNAISRLGWTALMWAAYQGRLDLVSALLAAGADPNAVSKAGLTALIRAAGQGHPEVVEALLEAGADARLAADGATAREWAERNGHQTVATLLARTPGGG